MTFVFGPQGFFGYSAASDKKLMWWSTSEATAEPDRSVVRTDDLKSTLQQVHEKWTDSVVRELIGQAQVDSIYPTWTIDNLPTWSADGLVILGDAAHALQPTSGQGSSQALEDSKTFTLLLKHYVRESANFGNENNTYQAIQKSSKASYDIRNPLIQKIAQFANRMSQKKKHLSVFEEYMLYSMMWLMGKLPFLGEIREFHNLKVRLTLYQGKLMLGNTQEQLMAWNAEDEINKYVRKDPPK